MNIKDFQESLEFLHKAEITPFIWGHAGIGKTSIVKQYAKNKGYKFFPLYLGTQSDVGDILGLASFTKDENGSEIATSFAPPVWLKDTIDYCTANPDSGAVLFLDEFNRGRRDILNGMFSLALDKTFHTLKLPKNCFIVAAGNPPTEEYYVTDVNETALMARFAHIKLEPTLQEWVNYARDNDFESSLISFVQEQPDLLEDHKSAFTLPVKVDRRSYERVNRLFKVGTPDGLLFQLMQGIIGLERSVAYKAHLQNREKVLTGEEVLDGSKLSIVQKWSDPADIKASMIASTCDNLVAYMTELNKTPDVVLTDSQTENLIKFSEVIPKDMMCALHLKLMQADLGLYHRFSCTKEAADRLIPIISVARGTTKAK